MAVEMGLNDFFLIENWTVVDHNNAHRRDLAWVNEEVATLEGNHDVTNIIVLTHWSPSLLPGVSDLRHAGSPITSGFSTDLTHESCFQSIKVKVWALGHTHYNCDIDIQRKGDSGKLRLFANQRGCYFAQADGFNNEKIIRL
jgi:hypothetical protein